MICFGAKSTEIYDNCSSALGIVVEQFGFGSKLVCVHGEFYTSNNTMQATKATESPPNWM